MATLETQEGSAYGAALLALVGSGEYATVPEACKAAVKETESIAPDASAAAYYNRAHKVYAAIYPALKPVYGMIADL